MCSDKCENCEETVTEPCDDTCFNDLQALIKEVKVTFFLWGMLTGGVIGVVIAVLIITQMMTK